MFNRGIWAEGLGKITKTLTQSSRYRGRDLRPCSFEYEAGVLTTRTRTSVVKLLLQLFRPVTFVSIISMPLLMWSEPIYRYKAKFIPLHATKALGGTEGIAPTHSRPQHYMGVSGRRDALTALYPRRMDPRYPLYRRLGGPQSRSGHRGYRKHPFSSAGNRTSIARSSSP
jgi:hypothetical protein